MCSPRVSQVVGREAPSEGNPSGTVVDFAGGAVEGRLVGDGAGVGTGGEGVVEDGAGDGGVGEVADVFPAEGKVGGGLHTVTSGEADQRPFGFDVPCFRFGGVVRIRRATRSRSSQVGSVSTGISGGSRRFSLTAKPERATAGSPGRSRDRSWSAAAGAAPRSSH